LFFTSYINRISNEPKTIGGLFKDLECELHTLAIAMQTFISILDEIAKIDEVVNRNEDFTNITDHRNSAFGVTYSKRDSAKE
jgi:tRNA 2-selenouridine synthase SelU